MISNHQDRSTSGLTLEMARRQTSEYAIALDSLSRISHSECEQKTIKNILELFTALFSPQKLFYVSLKKGIPEKIHCTSELAENEQAIKNRVADFPHKYALTASGNGFLVKISFKETTLGILEADEFLFPEYKDRYLNLALSIVDVCGLAIENARKYQQIKIDEQKIKQEKEKLEEAFGKIKTLTGLLPICSYCKKIRNDKGYWNDLETYIRENSEAEFSHGICQQCAKELFSDFDLYSEGSKS